MVRDLDFARRLETACEGNPNCPTEQYRGKQKWIYEGLESQFGMRVSPEAVRKWFAGESRPRPSAMKLLARLLEVDEAWLSLGITPDLTPREQRKRNAVADGAVNLVAGMIQMGGGSISFPEDAEIDILAIIAGKSMHLDVVLPFDLGRGQMRLTIHDPIEKKHTIVVIDQGRFRYQLLHLSPEMVKEHGERRGNFWELIVEDHGNGWMVGPHPVRAIASMKDVVTTH